MYVLQTSIVYITACYSSFSVTSRMFKKVLYMKTGVILSFNILNMEEVLIIEASSSLLCILLPLPKAGADLMTILW